MTIIRSPRKQSNFLIVSNDVLLDPRLSMRALGLLVRLLSRPDNWKTNSELLAREFKCGRDQMRTVLSELAGAGYVALQKSQDDKGQWLSSWVVFDEPVDVQPAPENRVLGDRVLGDPAFGGSGAIGSTDLTSTKKNIPAVQDDPAFDEAFKAYPSRIGGSNKTKARKAWDARIKAGAKPEDMLAGVRRYAAFCTKEGKTGGPFVMMAATFFGPDNHFLESYGQQVGAVHRWWVEAGFESTYEAHNYQCWAHNYQQFKDGKRVQP